MLNTVDFWVAIAFIISLLIIGKYAGASLKKMIDDYMVQERKKHQEALEILDLSRKAHEEAQHKVSHLGKDFAQLNQKLEEAKHQIEKNYQDQEEKIRRMSDTLFEDRKKNLTRHAHLITREQAAKIIKESLRIYFAHNWDKDRNNQLIISELSD